MIKIERLSEDRGQDYRDLRLGALQSEPVAFGSSYEEERLLTEANWRDRIKNALFAMEDNQPVGMVVVMRNNRIKQNHIAEIYGVYVKKEYRGKGIGKQLMEAALGEIYTQKDVTKIKIGVNPTQKAAEQLYWKMGFEKAGRLKNEMRIDGNYYDELVMEKYL
jgi:ribosomal protein S18 acetylase RimI-like enzyme